MTISARELSESLRSAAQGIDFTGMKKSTADIFTASKAASTSILGKINEQKGGIKSLSCELNTLAEQTKATLGPVVAKVTSDMPGATKHLVKDISSAGATRISEIDFDSDEISSLFASAKPAMTSASTMLHEIITDASPEALGKSLASITDKTLEVFAPAMEQIADSDFQSEVLAASQELQENEGIKSLTESLVSVAKSFGSATGQFSSGNFLKDLMEHKSYSITNSVRSINRGAPESILESITNKLLNSNPFGAKDEAISALEIPSGLKTIAANNGLSSIFKNEADATTFIERIFLIDPTGSATDIATLKENISKTKIALESTKGDVASVVEDSEVLSEDKRNESSKELGQPKSFSRIRSREQLTKYFQSAERELSTMVVHWSGHYSDAYNVGAKEIDNEYIAHSYAEQPYHIVIKKNGDIETGVTIHRESAHTLPDFRPLSIGVVFVAGYNESKPTDGSDGKLTVSSITRAQLASFNEITKAWYTVYPGADVFGQNDLDTDSISPGFNISNYIFNLLGKTNTCEPSIHKKFLTSEEIIQESVEIVGTTVSIGAQ